MSATLHARVLPCECATNDALPPAILLHGLFGSGSNLGQLGRAMAVRRDVHLLDLPGHGRSPWSSALTLPSMAQAVQRYIEADVGVSPVLVGHSLGGKVAMELALAQPALCVALVVADIAPVTYQARHDAVFAALRSVTERQLETREAAAEHIADCLADDETASFLSSSLRKDREGRYDWRFDRAALEANYASLIAAPTGERAYEGPTLFVKGGDSDYLVEEHWSAITRLFPAAVVKVMAGCGHWLHVQKPSLFNATVMRFLDSTMAARGR